FPPRALPGSPRAPVPERRQAAGQRGVTVPPRACVREARRCAIGPRGAHPGARARAGLPGCRRGPPGARTAPVMTPARWLQPAGRAHTREWLARDWLAREWLALQAPCAGEERERT